jgi:hypothetical protein
VVHCQLNETGASIIVKKTVSCVILISLLSLPAVAQLSVQRTGIFSNMRSINEAGEVVGTEIFLTHSRGEYSAFVQHVQGPTNIVALVKASVQGTKVSFDLPFDSLLVFHREGGAEERVMVHNVWRFEGELKDDRLVGKFNDWESFDLKRGKSYWQ